MKTISSLGLCPSNAISEEVTGKPPFPNVAGMGRSKPHGVDCRLQMELLAAGIESFDEPERYGEPHTVVAGRLCGWTFHRAWYYWRAAGPALPLKYATPLHESHGQSVRVYGHCGCPSPAEYCGSAGVDSYHVDNPAGLKALAESLRAAFGH